MIYLNVGEQELQYFSCVKTCIDVHAEYLTIVKMVRNKNRPAWELFLE